MENDDIMLEGISPEEQKIAPVEGTPPEQMDGPEEPIQEAPDAGEAAEPDAEAETPTEELPAGSEEHLEEPPVEPETPPKAKRKAPAKRASKSKKEPPTTPEETPEAGETPPEEQQPEPAEDAPQEVETQARPAAAPIPPAPLRAKPRPPARPKSFRDLDLRETDRNLSDAQREEWNEIYASYRSKSVISGHIMGVEESRFDVRDAESGELERRRITSVVMIPYRVKILIPETEMWMPGEERPGHVLRNMVGGKIDYVIMDIDRENECAIGSRRVALAADRHYFRTAKNGHEPGELLQCQVLAVGPRRCLVACGGYNITLTQRDMTYVSTPDLREKFHPGQELPCVLKEYEPSQDRMVISVKEVDPNPFDGAEERHPVRSRRQAVISGKYAGGVFCTLPDNTTCLCLYSAQHSDRDFHVGDTVILAIRQYDYHRKLIYGRILAKW